MFTLPTSCSPSLYGGPSTGQGAERARGVEGTAFRGGPGPVCPGLLRHPRSDQGEAGCRTGVHHRPYLLPDPGNGVPVTCTSGIGHETGPPRDRARIRRSANVREAGVNGKRTGQPPGT
ncbi:hypothetical protein GCM10010518_36870 [Kitasatospora cinereorecta]